MPMIKLPDLRIIQKARAYNVNASRRKAASNFLIGAGKPFRNTLKTYKPLARHGGNDGRKELNMYKEVNPKIHAFCEMLIRKAQANRKSKSKYWQTLDEAVKEGALEAEWKIARCNKQIDYFDLDDMDFYYWIYRIAEISPSLADYAVRELNKNYYILEKSTAYAIKELHDYIQCERILNGNIYRNLTQDEFNMTDLPEKIQELIEEGMFIFEEGLDFYDAT